MTPILFEAKETDFTHNGLGRLKDLQTCTATEVLNSEFELYCEYPITGSKASLIEDHALILAKPNKLDEPHLFRIYEHHINSDTDNIEIYAHSNTFDLAANMVVDVIIEDKTPLEAMNTIKTVSIEPCDFTFYSDIETPSSTRWQRQNLLHCIGGKEGSLIHYWGGEIKRGNRWLGLYKNRGSDKGVTIRHGRNLQGLTATYSVKGLVTAILPFVVLDQNGSGEDNVIVGEVVRSQHVDNYPHTFLQEVEFFREDGEQIEIEDEYGHVRMEYFIDEDILNSLAATWFEDNPNADIPAVNIQVQLEDLSQTSDYERFKALEELNLGDTVRVFSEKYNVELTAKVIKLVYDCLADKHTEIEIGRVKSTRFDDYREVVKSTFEPIAHTATAAHIAANRKNKIYRGEQEPDSGMIPNDLWYKPVGQGEVEMYRYDGLIWRIEKVSGGLIQGVLDAESGDLDIINLNADHITTGFLEGERVLLRGVGTAGEDLDLVSLLAARDETYSSQIESILEDDSISPAERLELQGTFLRIQRESREFYDQLIATENPDLIQIAEDMMVATDVLLEALEHVIGAEGYEDIDFEEMTILFNNYDELIVPVRDAVTALVDNRIKVYENQLKIEDDMITMMVHTDTGLNPVMSLGQEELAFYSEGEKVSWFAQRQMMIENAVVIQQLEIGNHIMKKYAGNKFTVFQWVGA